MLATDSVLQYVLLSTIFPIALLKLRMPKDNRLLARGNVRAFDVVDPLATRQRECLLCGSIRTTRCSGMLERVCADSGCTVWVAEQGTGVV